MASGIAVGNSILLISFSEAARLELKLSVPMPLARVPSADCAPF